MENFILNLFGIPYMVKFEKEKLDMNGMCGRVYFDDQVIKIKDSLKKDTKNNTILHEIIHIVLKSSGLESMIEKKEIDIESFTEILTNALYNVIKSNEEELKMMFPGTFIKGEVLETSENFDLNKARFG